MANSRAKTTLRLGAVIAILAFASSFGRAQRLFGQGGPAARISFLHISADAPALDVYIDGGRAISGLAFSEASAYLGLTAGNHQVQVTSSGRLDVLLTSALSAQTGSSYTWLLSGLVNPADAAAFVPVDQLFMRALQLIDNTSDAAGLGTRLRVVNASPGSGLLDVRFAPAGGAPIATNLVYGAVSGYSTLPPGTYPVSVLRSGETTPIATIPTVSIQAGAAYTLVLGGLLPGAAAGNPPNQVQGFQPVQLTDQNLQRTATLTTGCNLVILSLPTGTPIQSVVGRVADQRLVASVWRYDNALKLLRAGYFSDATAPLDYTATILSPEPAFICVSAATSWTPTS